MTSGTMRACIVLFWVAVSAATQAAPPAPQTPEDCHTPAELQAWRAREQEHMAWIPAMVQPGALRSLEQRYEKRLAELVGKQDGGAEAGRVPEPSPFPPLPLGAHWPGTNPVQLPSQPASPPQPHVPEPAPEPEQGNPLDYLAIHAGDFQYCTTLKQSVQLPRGVVDFPVLLASAEMCRTDQDLFTWRECQLAEVRDHVPPTYRRAVVGVLRAQFDQRLVALAPGVAPAPMPMLARLAATAPQLPAFLAVAAACNTEQELGAWRAHELKQIEVTVPKEYQRFALGSVQRTFARRLAQLAPAEVPEHPAAATSVSESAGTQPGQSSGLDANAAAVELAGGEVGVPHLKLKAFILIIFGLALPAALSLVGSSLAAKRQRQAAVAEFASGGVYLRQV